MSDKLCWSHHFRCFPPPRVCNKSIELTEAALRNFQFAVKEEVQVERAFNRAPMRLMKGTLRAEIIFYCAEHSDLAGMAKTVLEALRNGVLFADDKQVETLHIYTVFDDMASTFNLEIWEA